MTIESIEKAGGLWSCLVFIHFVVDWIFQTHHEAMSKHVNWKTRSVHCTIYTLGFVPAFWLLHFHAEEFATASIALWATHFALNTNYPIYLWSKYIRRVPTIRENGMDAFREFSGTSRGKILIIIVDQTMHITILWLIVWIALSGR